MEGSYHLKSACPRFKGLYEFCEELFNFHHKSTIVSIVFRNSMKVLGVMGKSNVIRVNSIRFLSNFVSAIENILNAREAHIEAYSYSE